MVELMEIGQMGSYDGAFEVKKAGFDEAVCKGTAVYMVCTKSNMDEVWEIMSNGSGL